MARGRPDYDVWSAPIRPTPAQSFDLFSFKFTIPANTAESSPQTLDLTLEEGTVNKVQIIIPPGHAGLAGLQILNDTEQVIPKSGWLEGNNDRLDFDVDIKITGTGDPPVYKFTAKGYNNDDTYEHTFYIRIWVLKGV